MNRLRLPASITTPRLPKGEHAFRRKYDTLAVRLNDKKEIYFSSTMHKANVADTCKKDGHGNNVGKLQVVHDYKKCIAGVDRNGESLGNYCCVRKSMKLTKE